MQQGARQGIGIRPSLLGQCSQRRAARIAQAHELGGFVKRLARRIVNRLAQQGVLPHPVDAHQLRVPAGNQQRHKRKAGRIGAQKRREQMAFQVVDADDRLVQRRRQRAGRARTHQQRPGQPRPAGESHHVNIVQCAPGLLQHLARQRHHAADVVTAGQLRHHAAESLVHLDLAVQSVGQQLRHLARTHGNQGHAGFIA